MAKLNKIPLSEGVISESIFTKLFSKVLQMFNRGKVKKLYARYENDPRLVKAGNDYFEAKDNLEKAIFDLEKEISNTDKLLKKL